ncbi:alpha-L-arabinofuranosidase C-terminal domain-containing protein [Foetidibacter luteolus]|uniref:alpha-L-arabinofuranosidase C-terminal domain-containing protein n=1 Tax=Foetidibacter luteolus TaxID=2608880 RepID=UPI00129B6193|nr:alpha-L-arabinofuranosidase C-terminal domain-containing protein [Foetidibacter luteolus]
MKKIFFYLLLAAPVCLAAQNATIKIDVSRTLAEIDPRIYGVFMEPIHLNGKRVGLPDSVDFNTLYGTLYQPSSPLADENGFRKDYIEAMKELKITNMRWPGGNFLMAYDWKDGIGPKDKRPTRINLAWGGLETNQVGTDEWIELNKAIGSENIICVNLGLANILDAAYWVEYCNYKNGTYYSDYRKNNGHAQPYNVKLWGLGNEVDGLPWELGHKVAEDYVETAREAAKAMKSVDSSIRFVGSGSSYYEPTGKWVDWNYKVLAGIGDKIDYLSIHRYWEGDGPSYYSNMGGGAMDFEEKINLTAGQIASVRAMKNFKNPIYIAVDEWGAFGRNFMNVLPIAQCLNSFIRHADVVKMANFTLLTSLLSSDPQKGTFKSPLFYTFKLFSNNCRGKSVDVYVNCDTFSTVKYTGIPYLDATAVHSKENNAVFINVVNRHETQAITADLFDIAGMLSGKAEVSVINTGNLEAPFEFDKQEQYKPVVKTVTIANGKLSLSLPAHSFTQLKISVVAK